MLEWIGCVRLRSHSVHVHLANLPPGHWGIQGRVGTAHLKSRMRYLLWRPDAGGWSLSMGKPTKNGVSGYPGGSGPYVFQNFQTHSRSDHRKTLQVKAASRRHTGTHWCWLVSHVPRTVGSKHSAFFPDPLGQKSWWSRKCCHWNHKTGSQPIKQSLTWASLNLKKN